jgi:hypothetical protein
LRFSHDARSSLGSDINRTGGTDIENDEFSPIQIRKNRPLITKWDTAHPRNPYPDTGESGEAYDAEMGSRQG